MELEKHYLKKRGERKKIKPYPLTYLKGRISIENPDMFPARVFSGDIGVQIADDGRIWVCIDGIAFLRFRPSSFLTGKEK